MVGFKELFIFVIVGYMFKNTHHLQKKYQIKIKYLINYLLNGRIQGMIYFFIFLFRME